MARICIWALCYIREDLLSLSVFAPSLWSWVEGLHVAYVQS